MHILHALFTRYSGGLEQAYVNVTQALTSKGHAVTALLRSDAPYFETVAADASSVVTSEPIGFYDFMAIWEMRRLLMRLRPDVILAHNGRAIRLLSSASRGLGIPVCGVSHSYKTKHTLRADALIVLTEHMRQHFIYAGYHKPLKVIPNGIYLPENLPIRSWKTPVVIGAIGRFTPEKGFVDLLHALSILKQAGVEFTLRLAGDGPQLPQLQAMVQLLGLQSQVRFEGWITNKAAFYRELQMLCIPSHEDSFSMVALEALANGVPVVATDAPGPMTIITHEVNGILVPRGDTDSMAEALQQLATQPQLAARLAQAGWQRVQSYSFPTVAKQWDEVLNDLTSVSSAQAA